MCPETSLPKAGGGHLARALCSDSKWQRVIVPGQLERGPQLQTGPKCYLRSIPQHWAENQSPSSPKKVLMWGFRKPGKGWASPMVKKRRCGEKDDEGSCHHSWWWPLWGRCWGRVSGNPSRAGHSAPLPSAARTVTGAPQGSATLLAMPEPAPPPELGTCPQKAPGLQHWPPGCSICPELLTAPELIHSFRRRIINENWITNTELVFLQGHESKLW